MERAGQVMDTGGHEVPIENIKNTDFLRVGDLKN
jgi:hypothetical protein